MAFEQALSGSPVELVASGCLGLCGSGPNVLVQESDQEPFWYDQVKTTEVPLIVQQHVIGGKPVWQWLSKVKHPHAQKEFGPPQAQARMIDRLRTFLDRDS